jgi:hypothetical protein
MPYKKELAEPLLDTSRWNKTQSSTDQQNKTHHNRHTFFKRLRTELFRLSASVDYYCERSRSIETGVPTDLSDCTRQLLNN